MEEENNRKEESFENIGQPTKYDSIRIEVQQEKAQEERTFEPLGQTKQYSSQTKKQGKSILIIVLILILAIIGGIVCFYFERMSNTQLIYKNLINKGMDALYDTGNSKEEQVKAHAKLDLDMDLEVAQEEELEEILDLINETEIEAKFEIDSNAKQVLLGLNSNYDNEDLLNIDLFMDAKNKETYAKLDQFFDKALKIEIDDSNYDELLSAFETEELTWTQQLIGSKAMSIIKKEFANIVKEEYCSKEKVTIKLDGKEVKVDAHILKMTMEQYQEEIETILKNLINNKKFLSCFENEEEVIETLEDALYEIEYADFEDATLCLKLYKKGLSQKLVRVDLEVEIEDGDKAIVTAVKEDGAYKINLGDSKDTLLTATIKKEEINKNDKKVETVIDIANVIKMKINLEYGYVTGEPIEKFETKNAIDINDITEEDAMEALEKLEDSKLYELIESFSDLPLGNNNDYDLNVDLDTDLNDDNDIDIDYNNNLKDTKDNEIITYDDNVKVTFNIEDGYEKSYASDTLKTFSKGDIYVSISSNYGDSDDASKEIENIKKTREDLEYKNVKVTKEKEIKVDGKTFTYSEISYDFLDTKFYEIYIWTELDDENMYWVEVETDGKSLDVTDIEDFLKIKY